MIKGKNQNRPSNNNGNNHNPNSNLKNSIASSGSMHENHVINIQLHQVCQVMTELQSMFRGFQDEMTTFNRKVDDRIKNKLTPCSPIVQIFATSTSIFIPITLQKLNNRLLLLKLL